MQRVYVRVLLPASALLFFILIRMVCRLQERSDTFKVMLITLLQDTLKRKMHTDELGETVES